MCLVGIIFAAACLFAILYWWSEGALSATEAITLQVIFGSLIIGLFAAHTALQFSSAFVLLAGCIGYLYYSNQIGTSKSFYKSRCEQYIAAIKSDPRNLAARECLADALYNLGQLDRAIDEIQAAVDMGCGMDAQYKLGKWTKERHFRDTLNPVCRWCETENIPGARRCVKCGADLPYENAFTRWLMGGKTSAARYYFLMLAGAGIICVSLLLLPLKFAFIPFFSCLLALGGWALVASARS